MCTKNNFFNNLVNDFIRQIFVLICIVFLVWTFSSQAAVTLEQEFLNASKNGELNQVMSLIQQGAKVDYKDDSGHTALSLAISSGYLSVVKQLVLSGANIDQVSIHGSPVQIAYEMGFPQIASFLTEMKHFQICSICQEEMNPAESEIFRGTCSHNYHKNCFSRVDRNQEKLTR